MAIDLSADKAQRDAALNDAAPSETISRNACDADLVQHALALLPAGGRSLEIGGGHQSLALAGTGLFQTTLLDVSDRALCAARQRFQSAGVAAEFVAGNVLDHAAAEFDLVFNNGPLDQSGLDKQVALVEAMASRSRKYVVSIAPNANCYWYWIWRILASSRGEWSRGVEVPVHNQAAVFRAAGLHNVRVAYLGDEWTEDTIVAIDGLGPELRDAILTIQRSPVIAREQKYHLVATVGEIAPSEAVASALWQVPEASSFDNDKMLAALADAVSMQVASQAKIAHLNTECSMLEAARNNAVQDSSQTQLSLQQVGRQLKGVSLRMVEYRETVTRLEASCAELLAQCAEWESRNEALKIQCAELEAHGMAVADQLTAEKDRIQAALDDANARLFAPQQELLAQRRSIPLKILYRLARLMPRDSRLYGQLLFVRRVLRRIKTDGAAHTASLAIGRALSRFQMNPYEYAFDMYLRDRQQKLPIRWSRVRVPGRPGLVSIVLPCYNGADMLPESLDSMLAQTYTDIEIIAINDGSSDETASILDAYAARDPRITVIHQQNRKLPRTLSSGFRRANGEFYTWTSVDNRMKPDCIARMVEDLQAHPDWDMIYANIDIIGEDGKPLRNTDWYGGYQVPPASEHIHLPRHTTELNTWPNNYIGAAFMYRARVAWTIGDYSPIRFLTEDYDYWMRINELMTLRHASFDNCIYDYRFHSNSLTSKDKELGITRNRVKLMVFDEFRRSFLLSKCAWTVSSDGSAAAQRAETAFKAELAARNIQTIAPATLNEYSLPQLWMPIAALHFAGDAQQLPADPIRHAGACRILVHTGTELPTSAHADWHVCTTLATRGPAQLARLGDDYRGWFSIADIADLATFCDTQAKQRQLELLEAALDPGAPTPQGGPILSVVICTYRRSAVLERAIRSLLKQSLPHDQYEIIIVNNDLVESHPRDILATIAAEPTQSARPAMRLIDCPLPGLSHARNAGLSESTGRYVVFIDDDALAKPDCLEWMRRAFTENPQAGVIGGHIRLHVPDPRPEVCPPGREGLWSQYLTSYLTFTELAAWWEFPYGALWGARRDVLFEMGGFRCNLGRIGNDFGGGEEIVAATLAQKLGYGVGVEPRAEVLHDVEPHRYTIEHVRKTIKAAEMVNYRMQASLHLPAESGLAATLRGVLSTLHPRSLASSRKPQASIEHLYRSSYAKARVTLLREKLTDFARKLQRPRVRD